MWSTIGSAAIHDSAGNEAILFMMIKDFNFCYFKMVQDKLGQPVYNDKRF